MINTNKLKGKIVERGLNIDELSKSIGMNKSTFYRRLNEKGETFSIKEVNKMCSTLNLTSEEATAIFFADNVARCANCH